MTEKIIQTLKCMNDVYCPTVYTYSIVRCTLLLFRVLDFSRDRVIDFLKWGLGKLEFQEIQDDESFTEYYS